MKNRITFRFVILFVISIISFPSFVLAMDLSENKQVGTAFEDEQVQNIDSNMNNSDDVNLVGGRSLANDIDYSVAEHEVLVVIKKVDVSGNALVGATLQIINSNGEIADEWVSDGSEHYVMLPEGDYILHEKEAPENYIIGEDKPFTVKVEVNELDAGVDFSETPCQHYGGTPLYFVEINGVKSEVYCINQDLETPDENSIYDGGIVTPDNIRNFTEQTVYIDAHQNTGLVDVSDQSLSSQELYDKVLDIIYHRQRATELFPDLTEAEIRYVTESALKNYTNAGLTRVQRVNVGKEPENYQSMDYYVSEGKFVWYLYPWFRSFIYDPSQLLGKDIYRTVVGCGDAFGNLARHWNDGHGAKNSEDVRNQIARYYELYLYLISGDEHHPEDMHLYIYHTNNKATDVSSFDFDNGAYQNLLGITWYNPYDEDVKRELTYVNEEAPKENKSIFTNPHTGDNIRFYFISFVLSVMFLACQMICLKDKKVYIFKTVEIS